MCLIAFSYKQHPKYHLVFAANRDEFYNRPTRPAQFWNNNPDILAGKDLKEGGTWMGISKVGDFSALTNYRDPTALKENPPSRGHLTLDFLKNDDNPVEYLQKVDNKAAHYNGFNLLVGNLQSLMYYSNQKQEIKKLEPGLYGLSNHLLDTSWPKVEKAKARLDEIIEDDTISREALFRLLQDDNEASEDKLPDTGIPRELEKAVSPIFIKTEKYGTRNSTVLLVQNDGRVVFEERRYKNGTQELEETNHYQFEIE